MIEPDRDTTLEDCMSSENFLFMGGFFRFMAAEFFEIEEPQAREPVVVSFG